MIYKRLFMFIGILGCVSLICLYISSEKQRVKGKRRDQRHVCTNIAPRENISKVPHLPLYRFAERHTLCFSLAERLDFQNNWQNSRLTFKGPRELWLIDVYRLKLTATQRNIVALRRVFFEPEVPILQSYLCYNVVCARCRIVHREVC